MGGVGMGGCGYVYVLPTLFPRVTNIGANPTVLGDSTAKIAA